MAMFHNAKYRAARSGIEFSITLDDIRQLAKGLTHCPWLGIELRWQCNFGSGVGRGKSKAHPHSPSLDRLDSSKGYVKGNIVIVSHRANAIKRDATAQELISMGQRIAEYEATMILKE
jgi:hypothetical protein